MTAGAGVEAEMKNYAAVSMELNTKDEIYSAMVIYGLLAYKEGEVFIPNRESMGKFQELFMNKESMGYVDFIFYPQRKTADALIVELKADSTPDDAVRQIEDKDYVLRLKGRLEEKQRHTGRILAVGISYNKKTKRHSCKVEVLQRGEP